MPKIIDVPGFGPTEFPDEMSDQDIVAAIQRSMIPAKPIEPEASWKTSLKNVSNALGQVVPTLKESAESVLEPIATVGSGLVGEIAGNISGAGSELYSRATGQPLVGNEVKQYFRDALTYQPRSKAAQANLATLGEAMQSNAGKLVQGLPVVGQELTVLSGLAGPAVKQATYPATQAVGGKLQSGAQKLMENALKATAGQIEAGDAAVAARELLKRNLIADQKGLDALNARLAQLHEMVAQEVKGSTASINMQKVISRLESARERALSGATPAADLAKINAVAEEFAAHPLIGGAENISVPLAQRLKKGIYDEVRTKAGSYELSTVDKDIRGTLARGLKEELNIANPALVPLNAEEAALYRTLKVAERRVIDELRKDPVSHAGAYSDPKVYAALTLNKSATAKALIARMLNKAGRALKPEMKPLQPAVPPAPTSGLPVPYQYRGDINPAEPYTPNFTMPGGSVPKAGTKENPIRWVTPEGPQPSSAPQLGFTPSAQGRNAFQNAALSDRMKAIRDAEIAAAEASAPRRPASGGMLFDLDPITGKLRAADQGIKGATPSVVQSSGNTFTSAMEKMASGRSFAMSPEERIAWSKRKVDLVESVPQLKGLSDEAIAARMRDIERELIDLEGGMLMPRAGTTPFLGQGQKTRSARRGMLYGEE